jgi:hypothetical protein
MNQQYNFPVSIVPITAGSKTIPNKFAIVRKDTNEPLSIVSKRYNLLKHADVIDTFKQSLVGLDYDEKTELGKNGAQLFATYTFKDKSLEVAKDDIVAMRLILRNSYDGTKTFQLALGACRLVCTNGMVIAKDIFSFSLKHYSNQMPEIEKISERITGMMKSFKELLPAMQKMDKQPLKSRPTLFKSSKDLFIPKYLLKEAEMVYNENKQTVWTYYNSLTFANTHKMRDKQNTPLARFEYLKRAWNVATKITK